MSDKKYFEWLDYEPGKRYVKDGNAVHGIYVTSNGAVKFNKGLTTGGTDETLLTPGTGIEITSGGTINCTLDNTLFVVVDQLPETGVENKFYLVPDGEHEGNHYIEYIYVKKIVSGSEVYVWEEVGRFKADTDLTDYVTFDEGDERYVAKSGDTMTGSLNMSNHYLTNVSGITAPNGSKSTDKYFSTSGTIESIPDISGLISEDTANGRFVAKSGDTMTGNLVMGNHNISGINTLTANAAGNQSANKYFATNGTIQTIPDVSGFVDKSGDTMSGALNMGNNQILDISSLVASGESLQSSTNYFATDGSIQSIPDVSGFISEPTANGRFVAKSGDTMSGVLYMGNNSITGINRLRTAEDENQADNKYFATNGTIQTIPDMSGFVAKTGDTMSGNLTMSHNLINNVSGITFDENGDSYIKKQDDILFIENNNGDVEISSDSQIYISSDVVGIISSEGDPNMYFATDGSVQSIPDVSGFISETTANGRFVAKSGDTMTGNLTMSHNLINNVSGITFDEYGDSYIKENNDDIVVYVDNGGNFSVYSTLNMRNHNISGVTGIYTSVSGGSSSNKYFATDGTIQDIPDMSGFVAKTGDTMSGNLTMSHNLINNVSGITFDSDDNNSPIIYEENGKLLIDNSNTIKINSGGQIYVDGVNISISASGLSINDRSNSSPNKYFATDGTIQSIPDVSGFVAKSGDTMTGDLNMNNHSVRNIISLVASGESLQSSTQYFATDGSIQNIPDISGLISETTANGRFVAKSGDTMSGNLVMGVGADVVTLDVFNSDSLRMSTDKNSNYIIVDNKNGVSVETPLSFIVHSTNSNEIKTDAYTIIETTEEGQGGGVNFRFDKDSGQVSFIPVEQTSGGAYVIRPGALDQVEEDQRSLAWIGTELLPFDSIYGKNIFTYNRVQTLSDRRLKNIHGEIDLDKAYDMIEKCSTIIYDLKSDEKHEAQIGVIAQEIEEFFPEIVTTLESGHKTVDYSKLSVVVMRVLKDLLERVKNLENK